MTDEEIVKIFDEIKNDFLKTISYDKLTDFLFDKKCPVREIQKEETNTNGELTCDSLTNK